MLKKQIFFISLFLITIFTIQNTDASQFKAVIFDCDGILVDTEENQYQATRHALEHFGIYLSREDFHGCIGKQAENVSALMSEQFGCAIDPQRYASLKRAMYKELQDSGVLPRQSGIDFFQTVIQAKEHYGIKIGIASACHREILQNNLNALGIFSHFDAVLSGMDDLGHIEDPDGTNKPKPYIYEECAQRLGVTPHECVVFEDSGSGVMAASTAGARVYAIPTEFTKSHDFTPAFRVTQFEGLDILQILTNEAQ